MHSLPISAFSTKPGTCGRALKNEDTQQCGMGKKQVIFFSFLFLALFPLLQLSAQNDLLGDRQKIRINNDWRFHLGDVQGDPTAEGFDDSDWQSVSVPHAPELVSLEMDSTLNSRPQLEYLRDVSWYRKQVEVPNTPGNRFVIEFEGVHQVTDLYVNGKHVGQYAVGGYTPFHFDVTDFVKPGQQNLIVVKADNSANEHAPPDPHKTDYIKYGGIYRDVYLVVTNPLHVTYNYEAYDAGVHITTPSVRNHDATITVKTTVRNENSSSTSARIVTRIIDADGLVLHTEEQRAEVSAGDDHTFRQSAAITENLHLWSPDNPYLYRVHSTIYEGETPVDFAENSLGIRWFELVDGNKFMLNGKPLWLVGVNRHQNYPIIGDATPDALGLAEAQQYKDAGMNCIRLSHYTQDESFIAACDRLGILVYEEAPTWIDWGDQEWWDNLEEALRTTIRAHRNHPSIFIWGAGINHRGDIPMMHFAAKEEDPWRLTASASSNGWTGRPNAGVSDVYATMDYRNAIIPDGDWTLSMEHRNTHDAEGNQLVINRYLKTARTFGALAWVGADYNQIIIEGSRRSYRSHSGMLDFFRRPRPVYHWYRAEYGQESMVHIADERGSYDGLVRVFSNAEEVELFHNGKLISKERPARGNDKNMLAHPAFYFQHDFQAGTLDAKAWINGKVVAEHSITKGGKAHQLEVSFSDAPVPFEAGGGDVRIVHARVLDEAGHPVVDADNRITFTVSGAGTLVDSPDKNIHPVLPEFGWTAMYVRSRTKPGEIVVTASSPGLASDEASITTVPFEADALSAIKAFREVPAIHLDLGKEGTLNEIGWKPWSDAGLTYTLSDFKGAKITLSGKDLEWSNYATLFSNLSYVGADGLFTEDQQITLTFTSLPAGHYQLKTYHHPRTGDGPLITQVKYEVEDASGKWAQNGRKAPMGYWDKSRLMEQEPLSGTISFSVGTNGEASVSVMPVTDKKGAFWLNGLVLKGK